MSEEQSNKNDMRDTLLSDDFFFPYQIACKRTFRILDEINLKIQEESDRSYIHFIKMRVKTPSSIYKKIKTKNLDLDEIYDIAGVRVVVHNNNDAYSLLEKIKEKTKSSNSMQIKDENIDDMIKNPKEDGYRAIHIKAKINISNKEGKEEKIPCEIQIRSITQDLWATLSHREIYKDIALPGKLCEKMNDLGKRLDEVDKYAAEIMKLIEGEKQKDKIPEIPIVQYSGYMPSGGTEPVFVKSGNTIVVVSPSSSRETIDAKLQLLSGMEKKKTTNKSKE